MPSNLEGATGHGAWPSDQRVTGVEPAQQHEGLGLEVPFWLFSAELGDCCDFRVPQRDPWLGDTAAMSYSATANYWSTGCCRSNPRWRSSGWGC